MKSAHAHLKFIGDAWPPLILNLEAYITVLSPLVLYTNVYGAIPFILTRSRRWYLRLPNEMWPVKIVFVREREIGRRLIEMIMMLK